MPPTPLPRRKLAVISLILFANNFSINVLWPFLPFMVKAFHPNLSTTEIGYKAGWLGSAYHLGSLFGSLAWGRFSDVRGRRPALLLGLAGTVISTVAFGFSFSFAFAILSRFMWGLLNGNIGIAKTSLSEICDDSNMAKAFSVIGLSGGFGRLTGPVVGGFLAMPASKFKSWRHFDWALKFPFALPCLVAASVNAAALLLSGVFLRETLQQPASYKKVTGDDDEESTAMTELTPSAGGVGNAATTELTPSASDGGGRCCCSSFRESAVFRLLQDPVVFTATSLYGCSGMVSIIVQECLPLWLVTARVDGGFGFSSNQIAIVGMSAAPFQLLSSLFIYPRLANRIGYRKLYMIGGVSLGATVALLPFASAIPTPYLTTLGWPALITLVGLIRVFTLWYFTSVFVLISNSVQSADRGTANGIGQTWAAAGRLIGPTLGATIFAFSEEDGHSQPFDHHFVFYVCATIAAWSAFRAHRLPTSIDRKKV